MNADGSNQVRLTTSTGASPNGSGDASWSPDGTKFLLATADAFGVSDPIVAISVSGGSVAAIALPPTYEHYAWPVWSPSGDRFALLGTVAAVLVFNANGTGPTALPRTELSDGHAWSPNGTSLAISKPGASNLRIVNVATGASFALSGLSGAVS